MRHRKHWWPIFMYGIGVSETNTYVRYCETFDLESKNKQNGASEKRYPDP